MYNFDSIIGKTDLIALAERAGCQLHKTGAEYRGRCVLHNGDNSNAFAVYTEAGKQRWKCFSHDCGQGDALDFVMKWRKCDLKTAFQYLGGDTQPATREEVQKATQERIDRAARELEQKITEAQRVLDEIKQTQSWIHYHEYLEANPDKRELWRMRGINDAFQDLWELGYSENFAISTQAGNWTTPTLSIPIYGPGRELLNVRHRLLNPPTPGDKYRPERAGLKAAPFLSDPDIGWNYDYILVVEGEIKAMVTYQTLDSPKWQVIGIPGKNIWTQITEKLQGHGVWICLDPDATEEAQAMAKEVKGRMIYLPDKIDDLINRKLLGQDQLRDILRKAR